MSPLARILCVCSVLMASGGSAIAQDATAPRKRPMLGSEPSGPLLSKSIEEKLKLTADQKDKIGKLEKEFADKSKDGAAKAREKMEKARADKDRQAMKNAMAELEEIKTMHAHYASKVQELLNADQKKLFTASAPESPPARAAGLSLLPPVVQERLGLSEDQKQKLKDLQKDFESKALQILNEEQRRTFEQYKSRLQGQPQPRKRPQQSSLRSLPLSVHAA